jgi:ketose-bisphosphate aldolase
LRGHYPVETDHISLELNQVFDATIIIPAFFEGGRVTYNNIHYVTDGDYLIPAADTIFAKDSHFGFTNSNLINWVVEKNKGKVNHNDVVSITLSDIREGGILAVAEKLESVNQGANVVVNVVNQHDLNTFVMAALHAEVNGRNFLYRSAASFVASRAGLETKNLLSASQFSDKTANNSNKNGGLIVVGSYVDKTTKQVKHALTNTNIMGIEVNVSQIINISKQQANKTIKSSSLDLFISKLAITIENSITRGADVMLYTSREFVKGATLDDIALVSSVLTGIVKKLKSRPSFLVAKGGITSNDIASDSLQIKTARVVGQIELGIPVWKTNNDCKFAGLHYIVFPGNVGSEDTLTKVALKLGVTRKSDIESNEQTNYMIGKLLQLRQAKQAIAAFNVYNLEGAQACVMAAEELKMPIILQVHPVALKFGGVALISMLFTLRKYASVPIFIHLDHSSDEKDIFVAIEKGFDSIMVDGSSMKYEDNLNWTKKITKIIHRENIIVEGELGLLAGEEDGLSIPEKAAKMTDPLQAKEFVKETNIDMLAVTIGNVHGPYRSQPQLDFKRLVSIRQNIPAHIPLVLHGASGLPHAMTQRCIAEGICKFNVNTDLRAAAMNSIKENIKNNAKCDVLNLMEGSKTAMYKVAKEKILSFMAGK